MKEQGGFFFDQRKKADQIDKKLSFWFFWIMKWYKIIQIRQNFDF